jgi:mono/diheme cytochrome c family protein
MKRAGCLTVLAMLLLGAGPLCAQETKEVRQGRSFAQRVCAACHATGPGPAASPVTAAPTFRAIAATPGMSRIALRVALESTHRTMPNLALTGEEIKGTIAYILSLQRQK